MTTTFRGIRHAADFDALAAFMAEFERVNG